MWPLEELQVLALALYFLALQFASWSTYKTALAYKIVT